MYHHRCYCFLALLLKLLRFCRLLLIRNGNFSIQKILKNPLNVPFLGEGPERAQAAKIKTSLPPHYTLISNSRNSNNYHNLPNIFLLILLFDKFIFLSFSSMDIKYSTLHTIKNNCFKFIKKK